MAPAGFLRLRPEEVPAAAHEDSANQVLEVLEGRVVVVVVLLDQLERPAAGENIATDQLAVQVVGELSVSGSPQLLDGLAEGQVAGPAEAVEE